MRSSKNQGLPHRYLVSHHRNQPIHFPERMLFCARIHHPTMPYSTPGSTPVLCDGWLACGLRRLCVFPVESFIRSETGFPQIASVLPTTLHRKHALRVRTDQSSRTWVADLADFHQRSRNRLPSLRPYISQFRNGKPPTRVVNSSIHSGGTPSAAGCSFPSEIHCRAHGNLTFMIRRVSPNSHLPPGLLATLQVFSGSGRSCLSSHVHFIDPSL